MGGCLVLDLFLVSHAPSIYHLQCEKTGVSYCKRWKLEVREWRRGEVRGWDQGYVWSQLSGRRHWQLKPGTPPPVRFPVAFHFCLPIKCTLQGRTSTSLRGMTGTRWRELLVHHLCSTYTSRSYYSSAVFILLGASDCAATVWGWCLFEGSI